MFQLLQVISLSLLSFKVNPDATIHLQPGEALSVLRSLINALDAMRVYTIACKESEIDYMTRPVATLDERWIRLAMCGAKIDAIKVLRSQYDLGLKEAKDMIEYVCSPSGGRAIAHDAFRAAIPSGSCDRSLTPRNGVQ